MSELASTQLLLSLPPAPDVPSVSTRDEMLGVLAGKQLPAIAQWLETAYPATEVDVHPFFRAAQIDVSGVPGGALNALHEFRSLQRVKDWGWEPRNLTDTLQQIAANPPDGWQLSAEVPGMESLTTNVLALWRLRAHHVEVVRSNVSLGLAVRADVRAARDNEQALVPVARQQMNVYLDELRAAIAAVKGS